MDEMWRTALWRQFGAAIDMLESAVAACPGTLWNERVWPDPEGQPLAPWFPPEFTRFWHVAYHAIFWLDLYLSGVPEEAFSPPAPFIWTESDPPASPEHAYTKEELLGYLAATRRKCHDTLAALTDEQARRVVDYPWAAGHAVSYLELQLYNMRHMQEHAAQLSLFVGQRAAGSAPDWVPRPKDESATH